MRERANLRVDVEDTAAASSGDALDSSDARTIQIATKFGVLNKGVHSDQLQEVVAGDEVVLFAIDLARTRGTRRVCGQR